MPRCPDVLRSGSELLVRAYCGSRDPFLLGCWPQRWPEHDPGLLNPSLTQCSIVPDTTTEGRIPGKGSWEYGQTETVLRFSSLGKFLYYATPTKVQGSFLVSSRGPLGGPTPKFMLPYAKPELLGLSQSFEPLSLLDSQLCPWFCPQFRGGLLP